MSDTLEPKLGSTSAPEHSTDSKPKTSPLAGAALAAAMMINTAEPKPSDIDDRPVDTRFIEEDVPALVVPTPDHLTPTIDASSGVNVAFPENPPTPTPEPPVAQTAEPTPAPVPARNSDLNSLHNDGLKTNPDINPLASQEFTNHSGESVTVHVGDTFEFVRFSKDGTRRVSVWKIVPIPESTNGFTPDIARARLQSGEYVDADAEVAPYEVGHELDFMGDSMPGIFKAQQATPKSATEPAAAPVGPIMEPAAAPAPESSPPAPGFHDEETKPYTAGMLRAATTQPAEPAPTHDGMIITSAHDPDATFRRGPDGAFKQTWPPPTAEAAPAATPTQAPRKSLWQRLRGK